MKTIYRVGTEYQTVALRKVTRDQARALFDKRYEELHHSNDDYTDFASKAEATAFMNTIEPDIHITGISNGIEVHITTATLEEVILDDDGDVTEWTLIDCGADSTTDEIMRAVYPQDYTDDDEEAD